MPIKRVIKHVQADIKRHRPIDWFAIFVLISLAFVVASILSDKVDKFSKDMDKEVEALQAHIEARR